MNDISYIIGHRGRSSYRLKNLEYVVKWAKQHFDDVIVVEQDTESHVRELVHGIGVRYIHVFSDKMYNRSWGFNVGAINSKHDFFMFGDNDLVMLNENIASVKEAITKDVETINPYTRVIDCDNAVSNSIINSIPVQLKGSSRGGIVYAGGILGIRKDIFEKIGGWEEGYEGWGGEDNDITVKLAKLNVKMQTEPYDSYHLFHERDLNSRAFHPNYKNNLKLNNDLKLITAEQIIIDGAKKIKLIGSVNKYV